MKTSKSSTSSDFIETEKENEKDNEKNNEKETPVLLRRKTRVRSRSVVVDEKEQESDDEADEVHYAEN